MPKRGDDSLRNILYNGHEPTCNCQECLIYKNAKPVSETIDPEEKDWVPTLTECPYCHDKSQMWNKKDKIYGCINIHCRKYYEYL
jgi:hypothetical protein